MNGHREEKPLKGLLSDLSRGMSRLIRQEIELAKIELSRSTKKFLHDALFLVVGGAVLYAGFLVLLFAAVAAISIVAPVWLSALAVAIVVSGCAYYLIQKGLSDLKKGLKPEHTVESLKEDKAWIQEKI